MFSETPDTAVGVKSRSHLRTLPNAPDPFEGTPATSWEARHAPALDHGICPAKTPARPIQLRLVSQPKRKHKAACQVTEPPPRGTSTGTATTAPATAHTPTCYLLPRWVWVQPDHTALPLVPESPPDGSQSN